MQKRFRASLSIKDAVYSEIKRAIRLKTWICFLEYDEHGSTYQEFYDLVDDYEYFCTAIKSSDDGSLNAIDALFKIGYDTSRLKVIRVAGVNTSHCVKETVKGLHKLLPHSNITIVRNCCNCVYNNNFKWVKGLKNVCLL